jgi:CBS-domain-containing membrane protein
MDRVSEIMIRDLVCCRATTKVEESISLMEKYECTKIPVIDKNNMIIGSVSKEDLNGDIHKVIECMSRDMRAVEEDSTVDECLRVMIINNIDELPVIDKQGHFCGIVTEKQLIKNH